jgi:predicted transcriptional regulator
MADLKKLDREEEVSVLDREDEQTLRAIDRAVKAADEGRVVSLEEARRRVQEWSTKSSFRKTP